VPFPFFLNHRVQDKLQDKANVTTFSNRTLHTSISMLKSTNYESVSC